MHAFRLAILGCVAVCAPAWLAHNLSPSATFFNQAIALLGWAALLALTVSSAKRGLLLPWRRLGWTLAVVALLAVATVTSLLFERLPAALMLSALGLFFAAALALVLGSLATQDQQGLFKTICFATVLAGLGSVVLALVQVFAPGWADGDWIARASTPGRAGGNLRQPNHLSSLLLWSMAALVWLHDATLERQSSEGTATSSARTALSQRALTAALMAALTLGVVLTVSRTGTVCIVLLALWGVVDKRLSRFARVMLWLTPLVYVLFWFGMTEWARASEFAGAVQLHKADPSSSRFGIWANTLELIRQNPWFGVGWGEFNFAWTLTPFPGRPVAFFDHTHNLPLQFLVELGIPLGTLVLALLAWSLWKAFKACLISPAPQSQMVRTAFVMVLMMAVHSMLEYPLWYAYFLLPTAFALGVCLGHSAAEAASAEPASPRVRQVLLGAAVALMVGTAYSVVDYTRVTAIFTAADDAPPLSQRIAAGQKSVFFAHHADYAAATVATHPSTAWKAFRRAPHLLLDTRLMIAWAKGYAEKGDVERARYLVDRLREFHNPEAAEFLAECDIARPAGMPAPFQCQPATRKFTYEDFKLR
ncbi:MAG: O-antigen ligase C-terminal domain-containing protein [Rhizobacter sp.]|nr:O-antigen ligase C-terminal domain-containing protein [Rhizobacter sp.]